MAGQSGLDSYFRGFLVSNLTHQNHVRVLPNNGTQTPGKGQVNFWIYLDLADALNLIFNGIFDSDNIDVRLVDGL